MTNGKLPTWFIIKWLEKHPDHVARTPRAHGVNALTVRVDGAQITCREDGWSIDLCRRSDWTIYNEHGKRVRFKKRKPRMTVPPFGTLTVRSGIRIVETLKALDKPIDVFIRERSR